MSYLLLLLTGLGVGVISAFFGVGGGVLIIPMLYFIFPGISPQTVVASSLGLISINSILNARNFKKDGRTPDKKIFLILTVSFVLGIFLGGHLLNEISELMVKRIFSYVVFIALIRTIFVKNEGHSDTEWKQHLGKSLFIKLPLIGLIAGTIAGLTGLGGGILLVPAFITILKIPLSLVPMYSNWIMAVGAGIGAVSHAFLESTPQALNELSPFQVGHVNFAVVVLLFIGASLTSKIGVRLSRQVPKNIAKILFIILLLVIGIKIYLSTI